MAEVVWLSNDTKEKRERAEREKGQKEGRKIKKRKTNKIMKAEKNGEYMYERGCQKRYLND